MKEEKIQLEYISNGKLYNNEKAIISITSWKRRINTVSKTLFSLLKNCPGFHIVLVLSEEEFKTKEQELPEDLLLLIETKQIELLWIYNNFKSFKKVLFTMDKYKDVPVISADDDCLYTCNYAEILYQKWLNNPECIITYRSSRDNMCLSPWGPGTLHPPGFYNLPEALKVMFYCLRLGHSHDDVFYGFYASMKKKGIITVHIKNMCIFLGSRTEYFNTSLSLVRIKHRINHGKLMQKAFKTCLNVTIRG